MSVSMNFNANDIPPSQPFEALPSGWYNCRIIESSVKPTANQKGSYLELVLTVIDGQFANRRLFDRLNLHNDNEQTVRIAYETLSAICHATGVIQLEDTAQLHGIPISVRVAQETVAGRDEPTNKVKGYKAIGENGGGEKGSTPSWVGSSQAPVAAPNLSPTAAPTQPKVAAVPPWAKK